MRYRFTGTVTVSAVAVVEAKTEGQARRLVSEYDIMHEAMVRGIPRTAIKSWVVEEFDGEVEGIHATAE